MFSKALGLSLLIGSSLATPTILEVGYQDIQVNGKAAKVMTIRQPNGTWGYYGWAGTNFDVIVRNKLAESTIIHWHGLELPADQDGTELSQAYIPAHGEYHYKFKLKNVGTYWMHSHYELQEAELAAAPLIISGPTDKKYQQVVVMFQDFNFTSPTQTLESLTGKPASAHTHMAGMNMGDMDMQDMSMPMNMVHAPESVSTHPAEMKMAKMDLNDVSYAAFLTNYRTPESPQISLVKPGQVKLRFINGSASSNFWINLGKLQGTTIAVDGRNIHPYHADKFQLSEAQRMDILVTIPKQGGTFPIIGQVEGLKNQTGLILTTNPKLTPAQIAHNAARVAPALNSNQELQLHSLQPLVNKPINQVIKYTLSGGMAPYVWKINGETWPNVTPAMIKQGDRVELIFDNQSMMTHPMHLHGYGFQIVEVNQHKVINGAIRDTIMIPAHESIKVILDATYPGKWFLHCHIGWHMPTGMMTYINVMPM